MASLKYTKMWTLLNEYKFEVDIVKYRDLICCVCKSLLKNAQQSICGCEFCYDCIKNYLSTDSKFCPGRSVGCKELMVNIERNLQVDHAANKKVANVTVRCPIDNCEFRTELKAMDDHIDSHSDNVSSQGKFLREPLEKLKKEMNGLQEGLDQCRKDCLNKEMVIMKIRDEMDRLRKASDAQAMEIGLLIDVMRRGGNASGGGNGKELALVGSHSAGKERMEEDEIDWQLEIHSDEIDGDLNGQQQRRDGQMLAIQSMQDLRNGGSAGGNGSGAQAGPFRMGQEIRELISLEVQKQLAAMQKWAGRNQQPQQQQPAGSAQEPGTATADAQQAPPTAVANEPGAAAEPSNSTSNSCGGTEPPKRATLKPGARRKLNRELPQVAAPLVAAPAAPSPAPAVGTKQQPTTTKFTPAPKPGKPLKAKIYSNSDKPIKPVKSTSLYARVAKNRAAALSRKRNYGFSNAPLMPAPSPLSSMRSIDTMRWMREIAPFEFVINNFRQKHLRALQGFPVTDDGISAPFYSSANGYRMCLRVDLGGASAGGAYGVPRSNTHLGVFFCVMRGENDDRLPWPMTAEVTVSLMDQLAFIPYTSRTFDYASAPPHWKYVFNHPAALDGQRWFGTPQFVHFDFLFSNPSLLYNGSIMIRCSVAA